MFRKALFIGLILLAVLIGWMQMSKMQAAQIANPASRYCLEQGGQHEIRKDANGNEIGVCVFDPGHECEEWALFQDNDCVAP